MLFDVAPVDISILTHRYNPLMQDNGFRQAGDFVPVKRYAARRPPPILSIITDDSAIGLSGFSLKKAFSNPIKSIVNVASRVATGGITLVTETGVLGSGAKQAGQKLDTIAAGAVGGAATGWVAGGFTPVGLVAGAVAGGVKGTVEATKTSGGGNEVKALYQGAAYGAGAGAITAAVNYGITSYATAQQAASANAAATAGYGAAAPTAFGTVNTEAAATAGYGAAGSTAAAGSAEAAANAGYGAAASTAGQASASAAASNPGALSTVGHALTSVGKGALSIAKDLGGVLLAQHLLGGTAANPAGPDQGLLPFFQPTTVGVPGGYPADGYIPGAPYAGGGSGSILGPTSTTLPGDTAGAPPPDNTVRNIAIAGAGAVALFFIVKRSRRARAA